MVPYGGDRPETFCDIRYIYIILDGAHTSPTPSLHHDLTLTGSQCVESFCCSRQLGKFNHSTLLIVVALKLWHATSGLYMSVVFTIFLHVAHTQLSLSSWEFFTTLDYEWAVIRGRLPYRWTILVCDNQCPYWRVLRLGLICLFDRFTLSLVWPLFWA